MHQNLGSAVREHVGEAGSLFADINWNCNGAEPLDRE